MSFKPRSVPGHGGTRPRPTTELNSPLLRAHGEALAASSLERIDASWPELMARYGERGRRLTAEDNLWHLNFLDTAVALCEPTLFDRYADWLVSFLGPRGLGPEHVGGVFGFLAEGLARLDCPPELEGHLGELRRILEATRDRILGVTEGPRGPEGTGKREEA